MSVKVYIYELEMLKLTDKPQVEIKAESEIARDAFFQRFLTDIDGKFFFDKAGDKGYNKQYIYAHKMVGVK